MSKIAIILRLLIGGIFLVSGTEKLIGPYQNFLYVIQNYEVLPPNLEILAAKYFPWFEMLVGLFLVLGLWFRYACYGSILMSLTFMTIVSQAMIRQLPITDCGCFGELISFPLHVVLIIDISILSISLLLLKFEKHASQFSLDAYYADAPQ